MSYNIQYETVETDINTREIYMGIEADCSVITERVVDGARGVMNEYSAIVEYITFIQEDGSQVGTCDEEVIKYFVGPYITQTMIAKLEELAIDKVR